MREVGSNGEDTPVMNLSDFPRNLRAHDVIELRKAEINYP
jgi:hypothetical protein